MLQVGRTHGGLVVGLVKCGQVEVGDNWLRVPQTKRDAVLRVVTLESGYRTRSRRLVVLEPTYRRQLSRRKKSGRKFESRDFPRVASSQPIVREFALLSGLLINSLLEQPVLVSSCRSPRLARTRSRWNLKHAANRPKPPLPRPMLFFSSSAKDSKEYPNDLNASEYARSTSYYPFVNALPCKNSWKYNTLASGFPCESARTYRSIFRRVVRERLAPSLGTCPRRRKGWSVSYSTGHGFVFGWIS